MTGNATHLNVSDMTRTVISAGTAGGQACEPFQRVKNVLVTTSSHRDYALKPAHSTSRSRKEYQSGTSHRSAGK